MRSVQTRDRHQHEEWSKRRADILDSVKGPFVALVDPILDFEDG